MGHLGRWPVRLGPLALVVLAALAGAGCGGVYPQSTLEPTTEFGDAIDGLFRNILWWEIGIFVVVEAALLYAVFRFRRKRPEGEPPQHHGHTGIEVAWTLAPALILVFIGVPTVLTIFRTQSPPPAESLRVQVIGHQWWWEIRYPDLGVVTANELHLPAGETAQLELTSKDVVHSFWIPMLGGKRDLVPGRTNHLWFTPRESGMFPGQCAEFCGVSHANMRMEAVVEPRAEFDAWVARQTTAPEPPTDSLLVQGAALFVKPQNLCMTCHTIEGVSQGPVGPNLTHVGGRRTIAAGVLPNDPEHMMNWIRRPSHYKPGTLMPQMPLEDAELQALAAYLQSLE